MQHESYLKHIEQSSLILQCLSLKSIRFDRIEVNLILVEPSQLVVTRSLFNMLYCNQFLYAFNCV